MNAGLLGEHLASPRTATKTNQNTALDPKPAERGTTSNSGEFAAYVAQDGHPSAPQADRGQTHSGESQPLVNDAAVDLADGQVSDPAPVSILASESPTPATSKRETQFAGSETPTGIERSSTPRTQAASNDEDVRVETTKSVFGDSSADQVSKSAIDQTGASARTATPAAEILPQDSRVRGQSVDVEHVADPRLRAAGSVDEAAASVRNLEDRVRIRRDQPVPGGMFSSREASLEHPDSGVPRSATSVPSPDLTAAELADTQMRVTVTDSTTVELTNTGLQPRDTAIISSEQPLNIGPTATTASAPSGAAPTGLTPTAPAIPIAGPNDLTAVIVNAVNNGIDPQEQLVVQLDPPELGRIMIDFKFDAQGLQQIVVTTENPEALRRLREMHFELTQALKEHGLSNQNMSFQQQAEGQSQQGRSTPDTSRSEAQFFAAEERRASPSAPSSAQRSLPRERLDLLL